MRKKEKKYLVTDYSDWSLNDLADRGTDLYTMFNTPTNKKPTDALKWFLFLSMELIELQKHMIDKMGMSEESFNNLCVNPQYN
jgi:hypothetical protein